MSKSSTLGDLQQYMKAFTQKQGWNVLNAPEKYLLFTEEVGELAKAIRHHLHLCEEQKTHSTPLHTKSQIEEELADVLNYLLDIANEFDIDLEKAFWKKDLLNQKRTWN